MKLSTTQQSVIDVLKQGYIIIYFRGIGTRFTPSANIEDIDGRGWKKISVTTFKALRDKFNLLQEFDRESYHSKYKLKS